MTLPPWKWQKVVKTNLTLKNRFKKDKSHSAAFKFRTTQKGTQTPFTALLFLQPHKSFPNFSSFKNFSEMKTLKKIDMFWKEKSAHKTCLLWSKEPPHPPKWKKKKRIPLMTKWFFFHLICNVKCSWLIKGAIKSEKSGRARSKVQRRMPPNFSTSAPLPLTWPKAFPETAGTLITVKIPPKEKKI